MKGEWISVKDRLPDNNREVLVWDGTYYRISCFDSEGWDFFISSMDNVTHWMELPKAPE